MQTTLDDELVVLPCRFIYMGFDIAMERQSWSHVGFIFFSIVSFDCIKPPNLYSAHYFHQTSTLHTISWNMFIFCFFLSSRTHYVSSLISCFLMTFRSSYYLQGIRPTEIFPLLFAFVCVEYQCRYFEKKIILLVFTLLSYITMSSSHLLSFWRAANVFSCAYILNLARPPHCQIPKQHQQALWYSGMLVIKYVHFWWVYHELSRHIFYLLNTDTDALFIQGWEELWLLPSLFSLFMIFLMDMARQFLLPPHLLLF